MTNRPTHWNPSLQSGRKGNKKPRLCMRGFLIAPKNSIYLYIDFLNMRLIFSSVAKLMDLASLAVSIAWRAMDLASLASF